MTKSIVTKSIVTASIVPADLASQRLGAETGCNPIETFATATAGRLHFKAAAALCAAAAILTLASVPVASVKLVPMPGFLAANQAALALVFGLTSLIFIAQYRSTRALSLLVLGMGSLFTTAMVLLQLVCFPDMLAPGLLVGQGAATLTWQWCFWHVGPPLCAILYALVEARAVAPTPRRLVARTLGIALSLVLFLTAVVAVLTTQAANLLPILVDTDAGYRMLTHSGFGPALSIFTILAFGMLCWTTRLRSVLQLWLAVSLFLLLLDNIVTDAGASRATIGWYLGRIEALLAGLAVLGVYLRELDTLYRRAADAVEAREAALREARSTRDNLEIALDASGMGDWALDLATGACRRTFRYDRIFGYATPQATWSFDRLLDHVLPDDRDRVTAAFASARTGGSLNVECRIRRVDDDAIRWIGLWGRTTVDDTGTAVAMAGCIADATERRSNEDRLREAERMEAIGQLTGGVAHDFNNLLTVILGSLDMIKRRPEDGERVRRLAENAFKAAQRGTDLTEKLLSFSRRQVVNPKTVNLNRLIGDFQPLLQHAVGAAVTIVSDLDAQLDPASIDIGQFQATILNLAGNARDAMPGGGTLTIRTRNIAITAESADRHPADIGPGDYLQVTVADTGIGMDAATAARAFEPFFTTKDVGRGTGLGLSQVYGFARQAGGTCMVRSASGEGCAVVLYLPRSQNKADHGDGSATILPLRRASGQEVVLIVEDEDALREMAAESLQTLGYRVLTAADAHVALRILKGPTKVDILFSDVVMPGGMNGAQLAVQARDQRPNLKVLLTSGYTTTATGGTRDLPPGVPLLRKPYLREELAATLETVMTVEAVRA